MTDYNIDFLIAGLVFLIFLLIHFQRYKKLNNISGRTFWFLIIAGIFDIIFDLLSSILLVKSNPAYNSWMIFFSTMLYILQMIVVYIFYNYTQALRHCDEDIRTRNIKIMAVPILCMEVAIEPTRPCGQTGFVVETDYLGRSVKAQMKYANKLNAKNTIIIGDDELAKNEGNVKNMETREVTTISLDKIADCLK